jgi:hypothetical protein
MSEITLTGLSCETNRGAAKQLHTRRNRRVDAQRKKNATAVCHTFETRAKKSWLMHIKRGGSSSQDFIKISNKENNVSHDNLQ